MSVFDHSVMADPDIASAVINDSDEGSLTTREVEDAVRSHCSERNISSNTISYTLTLSKDFKQVFPDGRGPGKWYLTGSTEGV
ncbi:hypothetical protein FRC00_009952, partial [Tulasnella sp. 408]